jgi:hypothetical protein
MGTERDGEVVGLAGLRYCNEQTQATVGLLWHPRSYPRPARRAIHAASRRRLWVTPREPSVGT